MTLRNIYASVPVNKTAAQVTGRGVHWEPEKNLLSPGQVRSETPLPTRPWPQTSLGQDNLTGRIVGRFTVIGLSAEKRRSHSGSRWVVRCSCGAYEHRTTKGIRRSDLAGMMCVRCDYTDQMIKGNVP
jgi:hypothetical protein